jgi:hypothetical protein
MKKAFSFQEKEEQGSPMKKLTVNTKLGEFPRVAVEV